MGPQLSPPLQQLWAGWIHGHREGGTHGLLTDGGLGCRLSRIESRKEIISQHSSREVNEFSFRTQ